MTQAPASLPADLLERTPQEGARLLALLLLDAAAAARPRLDDPNDAEALHDFRVALRRLRSTLRAFKGVLGDAVPRRLRRRVADLADATNPARDAEVQLLWLRRVSRTLAPPARRGASWLCGRLQAIEGEARERGRGAIAAGYLGVDRSLRKRLHVLRLNLDLSRAERPTFGGFVGEQLRAHAAELGRDLAAVATLADVEPAHRARIAAKRLRYLLDPFRRQIAGFHAAAEALVERLKSLQDELGDLRDAQVLTRTIADLAAEAAAQRARRRVELAEEHGSDATLVRAARRGPSPPSMLPLIDLLRAEQLTRFAALERDWLGGRAQDFLTGVDALAVALGAVVPDASALESA